MAPITDSALDTDPPVIGGAGYAPDLTDVYPECVHKQENP